MSYAPINTTVVAPVTGGTVTAPSGPRTTLILNPAATLATLTVNFNPSPLDKDQLTIGTTKAVTLLTMVGGTNTILGPLSSLLLNGYGRWQFVSSLGLWVRIG